MSAAIEVADHPLVGRRVRYRWPNMGTVQSGIVVRVEMFQPSIVHVATGERTVATGERTLTGAPYPIAIVESRDACGARTVACVSLVDLDDGTSPGLWDARAYVHYAREQEDRGLAYAAEDADMYGAGEGVLGQADSAARWWICAALALLFAAPAHYGSIERPAWMRIAQ